jgi:hypothetical protein
VLVPQSSIWFVHSKDDPVTVPDKTVVPLHKRLMAAGAQNIVFSYYDHGEVGGTVKVSWTSSDLII